MWLSEGGNEGQTCSVSFAPHSRFRCCHHSTPLQTNLRKERQRQRQRQQLIRLQRTSSGAGAGSSAASPLARISNWGRGLELPSVFAASPSDSTATTPVSGRSSALARLQRVTSGVFSSPRAATPGTAGTAGSASPGSSARRTTTGGVLGGRLRRASAMLMPRSQSAPEGVAVAVAPAAGRGLLPQLEEAAEAMVVVSIPDSVPGAQEPEHR